MPVPNRYNGGGPIAGVVLNDADGNPYTAGGGTAGTPSVIAGGTNTAPASNTNPVPVATGALPLGTNRSGTATTTSGGLAVAANTARRFLVGQNIGANNIGFNEFGGTAAIGTAGTYTVAPGVGFSISTQNAVNFIAATGSTAVTMTEG